jgi:hypothetical protein
MQYALLICTKPGAAEALGAQEQEANHREYLGIRKLPGVVGGAALHPVETATTAPNPRSRWPESRSACRPVRRRSASGRGHGAGRLVTLKTFRPNGPGVTPSPVSVPSSRPRRWSSSAHQHRTDVERRELDELLHDVDHALQPGLVHAADRSRADRIATLGDSRCDPAPTASYAAGEERYNL